MKEQSLQPVIEKLENLFEKANSRFYNGELQKPVITVSPDSTKGAYSWCTAYKAWKNAEATGDKDGFYEINICSTFRTAFRTQAGAVSTTIRSSRKLLNNTDFTLKRILLTVGQSPP